MSLTAQGTCRSPEKSFPRGDVLLRLTCSRKTKNLLSCFLPPEVTPLTGAIRPSEAAAGNALGKGRAASPCAFPDTGVRDQSSCCTCLELWSFSVTSRDILPLKPGLGLRCLVHVHPALASPGDQNGRTDRGTFIRPFLSKSSGSSTYSIDSGAKMPGLNFQLSCCLMSKLLNLSVPQFPFL